MASVGQERVELSLGLCVGDPRKDVSQVLGWLDAVRDAGADEGIGTGKILPRRITGLTAVQQRHITKIIKQARNLLLMK